MRNFAPQNDLKAYCGVEQLVARWAHSPKVAGSSPASATKVKKTAPGTGDTPTTLYLIAPTCPGHF